MTPREFREAAVALGGTLSGFARLLQRFGDPRSEDTIVRHLRRLSAGKALVRPELVVVLRLLRERKDG